MVNYFILDSSIPKKFIAILSIFLILSMPISFAYDLNYDANGNLIKDGKYNYEYDEFNKLVKIKDLNGNIIEEYVYDDVGNRIKKIDRLNNKVTYYPDGNLVRENGQDIIYYYANDNLVAKKDSSGTYYYQSDHLGSTTLITDSFGNKIEETSYLPFGGVFEGGNDRFLFTGKELDNSDLYYYGARYYSPTLGHFTQPDTVIQDVYDPQSLNRYSYVRNNPYKYNDPTGYYFSPLDFLDYASLVESIYSMIKDPSVENALWLAVDTIFVAIPIVGGFGIAGKSIKYGGKAVKGIDKIEDVKDASKSINNLRRGDRVLEVFEKNSNFIRNSKVLMKGESRTNVIVKSYDEAFALLADFDNSLKSIGEKPLQRIPKGDLKPGQYRIQFWRNLDPKSPNYGRIYSHENLPLNNLHATNPHINIKHPITKNEVTIIIDNLAK